jgi:hypothetical protein
MTYLNDLGPMHRTPEETYAVFRDFHNISKNVTAMVMERKREKEATLYEDEVEFIDLAYEPACGLKFYVRRS